MNRKRAVVRILLLGFAVLLAGQTPPPSGQEMPPAWEGPPREAMEASFRTMFEEILRHQDEATGHLKEALRQPALSDEERAALEPLIEAHGRIRKKARQALAASKRASAEELQRLERSIRKEEMRLPLLHHQRERAMMVHVAGQIADKRVQRKLVRRIEALFKKRIELEEQRIELEEALWAVSDELDAAFRPEPPR